MKTETEAYAASELEQVAHCFAYWRHHRANRNAPIPQPLWHQAVTLSTTLPLPQVAKRLGLKSTTLKKHCAAHNGSRPQEATPNADVSLGFAEVTPPPAWPRHTPPTEVELQRADGARLRIHCRETQFPLADLIRTFLEVS